MLRRILACLALFTGLAALGSTAQASIVDAINCEVGVSAQAADDSADERRACEEEAGKSTRRDPGKSGQPAKRMRKYFRPPVLFGVDRAYE